MPDRFEMAVQRWDVSRWLRQSGHEVSYSGSNQAIVACPGPNCNSDKRRLYVNLRTKLWICHRCNKKGNAVGLVMFFSGVSQSEAARLILTTASSRGVAQDEPERVVEAPAHVEMHPNYHPLVMPETDRSRPFWDYVLGRGLSPTLVMKYKLGYIRTGSERNRLVLPIYQDGELAGYTARAMGKSNMKYWTPTWCHTSELLFNLDEVLGKDEVILVEGQFDALRLPDRAVCTFGKKLSSAQAGMLVRAGFKRITFCYDADASDAGYDFAARMSDTMEVYKATLPPGYDPGDAPMRLLLRAIEDAERVPAFRARRRAG